MGFASPLALLLLQLAVILALSRLMGLAFARIRQPQVIGEIVAGLMLGPSLFGWVWPDAFRTLFGNPAAMTSLNLLAQVGVLLFLFCIGLEFDTHLIRRRGKAAAAISISGICVPFVLGFTVTFLMRHVFDDIHRSNLMPTALFMGAAMSVTAFPVLARIVTEWGLQRTEAGSLAIAAAAVDDVLAWTLLAVVVAFAPASGAVGHTVGDATGPASILGWASVYLVVMVFAVRPALGRIYSTFSRRHDVMLAVLLFVMLLSAFVCEQIGVHALFGAFVAGLCAPKHARLVEDVRLRIEPFVLVFLLPIFFAYAGFKVDLRTLMTPGLIGYTLLLSGIACLGKLGGTLVASRLAGVDGRSSLLVGVLMNTRGLMELIILTVGLQLGVINATVYGMMVIMALVTTAMAAPLLHLIGVRRGTSSGTSSEGSIS